MGAQTFYDEGTGSDPKLVFKDLVKEALHWYGHSPYSGTIKEKNDFVMATKDVLSVEDAYSLANKLISTPDYSNKWGPAGCIQMLPSEGNTTPRYLFFGWASS
jgi:hypothetical protein